ncbi:MULTISPECIES: hypothetical protein [unclassified Streptomyces]|uniref:hypothetical protein n=1 Tax=unclassified Streptomyces TaxID=2593676 RepID=UPI0013A70ACD|nr:MULTISPECIES: hypothetical protein [unclassified Streptomyces]
MSDGIKGPFIDFPEEGSAGDGTDAGDNSTEDGTESTAVISGAAAGGVAAVAAASGAAYHYRSGPETPTEEDGFAENVEELS